jgi:adenylate cyclase
VVHRDHVVACVTLDRVIDQAPFCPMAWSMKARVLVQMGEGEDAVFHANQAEALPSMGFDCAWRSTVTALAHYAADGYADAVRWARVAAMHHPGLAQTFRVLAASLVVLGQLDEAQQAAARALAISPEFRIGTWRLQSSFTAEMRERYAQRLRLAGLPE